MTAPEPDTEESRLAALRECKVLDTDTEDTYDDIVRLAAHVCGVPISAITLVDSERQWFKSILGLGVRETPRASSFCAHAILQPEVMVIPDACEDKRFADNALVTGAPHIRFYAGAPLVTEDGHALGALCVIDSVPRQITPDQESALRLLARQAAGQLEMARRLAFQERLIAERTVAETERQRLAAIVESSEDSIVSIDLSGLVTSWNKGAERAMGLTRSQAIGQHILELAPPGQAIPLAQHFESLRLGRVSPPIEITHPHADGPDREALLTVSPIRDASGELVGASIIARDVTEERLKEEALRDSMQFVESIADQSTSIIFVFDLDTMANVYSNRNVGEFLGYSLEQVQEMGSNLLSVMLHPDDLPLVQSHFAQFADKADGDVVEMEYRARHGSGEWRWIWNRETVFKRHADGTPRQILGTANDITERKQAQEEQARLAAIVESSQDAIMGATLDGIIVSWNAAAERIYGYAEADIIGRHASVLAPPAERHFLAAVTQAILRGERCESLEVRRRRKNGAWIDISLTFSPIKNTADETTGIAAIGRDITVQKRAEVALQQSEEALRTIMEGAPVVLYATDKDGVITLSEGAGLERLGLAPGEVVGRNVFDMYRDVPFIADNLRRVLAGETVSYDADLNGLCYHNEVRPQRDAQGVVTGMTGVGHDITERKQAEQSLKDFAIVLEFQKQELEKANAELEALATLDGLTGLRNRRAFDERLGEEFERASRYQKPLSLLLLDIDFFKQYNDSFGHPAGDEALRAIGRVLQKATRETDFLARYGGEEIAVILPETDGDGALQVAERVRIAIATAHWEYRGITASLGVGTLRLEMERSEDLLSCADRALYRSKAEGRNRVTHGIGLPADYPPAAMTPLTPAS